MHRLLIASVALIGLSATAAYAGEGNGDPFPGPNAAVNTTIGRHPYVAKDQDPFQMRIAGNTTSLEGVKLSIDHSQDPFQYRVAGTRLGDPAPAFASRNQAPTATNVKTEAATPHG